MTSFSKKAVLTGLSLVTIFGVVLSIGLNPQNGVLAEASDTPVSVTLPTSALDSTTSFTTTTLMSGTGGLGETGQTIISTALVVASVYSGVNGFLFGPGGTEPTTGNFVFKTSHYVVSLSATFTKYSTELATIFIRSGGTAQAVSAPGGEIGVTQAFLESENTMTVTWAPVASYYFTIGTKSSGATTNNAYLTSLNIVYNDTMKLSLVNSFDLSDGGSSSNTSYTAENVATSVNYEINNPSGLTGTTAWVADYIYAYSSIGTTLGSGLTARPSVAQTNDTTAWANLRTDFAFIQSINVIKVLSAVNNSGTLDTLGLQSSLDKVSWATVSTKTPSDIVKGILTFDGFTIAAGSYLRFGVTWTGATAFFQFCLTGLEVYSYSLCA